MQLLSYSSSPDENQECTASTLFLVRFVASISQPVRNFMQLGGDLGKIAAKYSKFRTRIVPKSPDIATSYNYTVCDFHLKLGREKSATCSDSTLYKTCVMLCLAYSSKVLCYISYVCMCSLTIGWNYLEKD